MTKRSRSYTFTRRAALDLTRLALLVAVVGVVGWIIKTRQEQAFEATQTKSWAPPPRFSDALGRVINRLSPSEFVLSPNGKQAVFTSAKNRYLYAVNADGSNLRRLTFSAVPGDAEALAWSPDSRMIAFSLTLHQNIETKSQIYLIRVKSGKITRLTHNENDTDAQFSPDGRTIAFASVPAYVEMGENHSIFMIDVKSHHQKRLTRAKIEDREGYVEDQRQPTFSPDGRQISYGFNRTMISEVTRSGSKTINLNGNGLTASASIRRATISRNGSN